MGFLSAEDFAFLWWRSEGPPVMDLNSLITAQIYVIHWLSYGFTDG